MVLKLWKSFLEVTFAKVWKLPQTPRSWQSGSELSRSSHEPVRLRLQLPPCRAWLWRQWWCSCQIGQNDARCSHSITMVNTQVTWDQRLVKITFVSLCPHQSSIAPYMFIDALKFHRPRRRGYIKGYTQQGEKQCSHGNPQRKKKTHDGIVKVRKTNVSSCVIHCDSASFVAATILPL